MAKSLIDELHVSIYVSTKLPASVTDAIGKTLKGKRLNLQINGAVRAVFRRYRSLSRCTIKVSR